MREYIDITYYFGELKMWYDTRTDNSVAVIVESASDEKLYRKLLKTSCVYFSVEGWKNAIELLQKSEEEKYIGIIAIIDADFKRILNITPCSSNLFYTDYHDKELMMINSDAWINILDFYTDKKLLSNFEKNKNIAIKDFIQITAKPISSLRFLNETKQLNLKFKILTKNNGYKFIEYDKFIDKKTFNLNFTKMFEQVENKSQKQGFFKINNSLINEYKEILQKKFDLNEFTNGHDFINILSLSFEVLISNRKSSKKVDCADLENDFIKNYRKIDFEKTNLYSSLKNCKMNLSKYKIID